MIQLKILSGKKAGAVWAARRFPVRIGRSPRADLRLEEDGIWDEHLLLATDREEGFVLSTRGEALASVNGEPLTHAALRNGDSIELGPVKLEFWLADTVQSSLGVREALTWAGIATVVLVEVALLYLLLG